MTLPLIALLAACSDDAKTDALSARLDKLEAADPVDASALQASIDALDARTTTLEESTSKLDTNASAIGQRVTALERASGNDFWSVSGSCACGVSTATTWLDVSGATMYVSTTKGGPITVWANLSATNVYANARVHVESTDGAWSDDSVGSEGGYGGSVSVVGLFEPPAGDYAVTLQYSNTNGGSGMLEDYAIVAIQLTEGV
ncbi:hypothetical protein LBMAG42_51990 [Deltaproteobacteria bacterium]|nr:hypothetical protein LBMAG42_51990 [Deltaproteobacteria bacterium]